MSANGSTTTKEREAVEEVQAAASPLGTTVYERKLKVMGRCDSIRRDASYVVQNKRVEYVSITHLCDQLRRACVAEGLDVNTSIADGVVTISLTNAAKPEEFIVSTWPVVPNDKGWSYSVKYALIRMFLIGDGEEDDEAGAHNSSTAANDQQRQTPRPAAVVAPGATLAPSRVSLLADVMAMDGQSRMTILRSFGYRGSALNQWVGNLDDDVVAKLARAIKPGNEDVSNDDDIPF